MSVIEFISKIKRLSPEGRYLLLAITFEQSKSWSKFIDVSVLCDRFGVSHKVVSELLEYLQSHRLGEVTKIAHGRRLFTFYSKDGNDFNFNEPEYIYEALIGLFSFLQKRGSEGKNINIRPSNLLLMVILVLHANELGFIQASILANKELLTDTKIRRLMGGISQSRLKSQLATLRSVGFIKRMNEGGVSSIYFGKFEKHYQIDFGCIFPKKITREAICSMRSIKHIDNLAYETPEHYLTLKNAMDGSFKYEFDFEFPFKLSYFIYKVKRIYYREHTFNQKIKSEFIDGFNIDYFERAPFFRCEKFISCILSKLEVLTAYILENYFHLIAGFISRNRFGLVSKEDVKRLEDKIKLDCQLVSYLDENQIFTNKYLNEIGDVHLLKDKYFFWKNSLISLAVGLSLSLVKLIRYQFNYTVDVKMISLIFHDFVGYDYKQGQYPRCDISMSFNIDDSIYDVEVINSKDYVSNTLCRRRLMGVDNQNLMIKKHVYSVWLWRTEK